MLFDVRVNDRQTLNLGDGVYDFRSFSVDTNVTMNVTDRTVLQIDRGWSVNDGLQFGIGTRADTRVYLGALGFNPNGTPVINFAHRGELHMQFFAPSGWLDMGGQNQLFGRYWGQRISGDASNDVTRQEPPPSTDLPGESGEARRYQCYEST